LHFGPEINERNLTFSSDSDACSSIFTSSFICPFRKTLWILHIRISAIVFRNYSSMINLYSIRHLNLKQRKPIKQYLSRASSSMGGGVMRRT
jgi:hypothetical protein